VKVLYFHQHFTTPRGASGTRSYEFARALIARGHSVTMVCGAGALAGLDLPADSRRRWSRGMVDGIDVIALPLAYSNRDGLARRTWCFLSFAFRSVGLALREDCDLVFASSTPLTAALPGIFARWLRGKPFIFEVRDLWPELPRALGLTNPLVLGGMSILEWCAYRSSTAAVGLSPGIVEGIRRRSVRTLPIAMIPNGCDLDLFRPELRRTLSLPGLASGDFVAGFTGAHGVANGLDAVLDAAGVLQRSGDRRIKIVFIGDGKEKDRLRARAEREGLENCIFLPAMPKTELASVTASLDCGLMILKNVPAFYFGTSPNKFFDYLAAGVPVLNNYPGWLAEMIEAGGCGIVVPPDEPATLAGALRRLASDAEECRRMGAAGRRLAEHDFARPALADQFVHWLEAHTPRAQAAALAERT
jgi:glycosyltransferase involved in cell wall biosynthesis